MRSDSVAAGLGAHTTSIFPGAACSASGQLTGTLVCLGLQHLLDRGKRLFNIDTVTIVPVVNLGFLDKLMILCLLLLLHTEGLIALCDGQGLRL